MGLCDDNLRPCHLDFSLCLVLRVQSGKDMYKFGKMDGKFDEATEIRKLPAFYLAELARILSISNQWKDLMGRVPKKLSKESYECEIDDGNSAKFISEHYSLIEEASQSTGRLSSEILLDEWGCSGRVRPALGHLLYLLKKSELYRAADYVSKDILKKGPVERPSQGPPARVQIHSMTQRVLDGVYESNGDLQKGRGNIYESILPNITEFNPPSRKPPPLSDLLNPDQNAEKSKRKVDLPPPFSDLMNPSSQDSSLPNISVFNADRPQSNFLPPFSDLLHPSLPKLTPTTHLQSFSYQELEAATDNFNATPLTKADVSGRFLGSGAFGSVHFALGLFDQPVAVKRIFLKNAVLGEDDFVLRQFKNEVEVLCDYQHKNLLRLFGFSCDGPAYCLVYEYISGGNLKDRLQETEDVLRWAERVAIAGGIAEAVNFLHTAKGKPLIHRDIKTANVLLDASNAPKLCDFGTLRISSTTTTETTKIYGTSAYMAPEANRGDVSVKMDTYSFGVVLLELLTSLPVIDYRREGCDLVTYVEDSITEDIAPLLDTRAGSWSSEGINFANELYRISGKCLEEKRYRPTMTDIDKQLLKLTQKVAR